VKLVIKQHRPLRRALIGAGIVLATLAVVAITVDLGQWRSLARIVMPGVGSGAEGEEIEILREENSTLRYEVARLKRGQEIDKSARGENHLQFVHLQAEVSQLKAEVAFYRDIVAAPDSAAGAQVKGIHLRPLDSPGRFSYRLVLAHIDENDVVAEGSIRIAIKGELKGQLKTLAQGEVLEAGSDNLAFKFKHFRLFEGSLKLPDGFIPRQISVAVQSRIPAQSSSFETYDWSTVRN